MNKKWRNRIFTMLFVTVMVGTSSLPVTAAEFSDGEGDAAGVEFSSGEDVFTEEGKAASESEGETPEEKVVYNGIIYELYNHDYMVVGYTDELKDRENIVIEEYIDEVMVTGLETGCFMGLKGIKTISVPGTVGIIGDFYDDYDEITIKCPSKSEISSWAARKEIKQDNSNYPPETLTKDGADYLLIRSSKDVKRYIALYGFSIPTYTKDVTEGVEDIKYESEIEGIPVTELSTNFYLSWFQDGSNFSVLNVKSFYIPASIRTVANREFGIYSFVDWDGEDMVGYRNLETVTFEESATPIQLGKNLFEGCTSLREVDFSSRVKELPEKTFIDCPSMKSLELPTGLEKIGGAALQGLKNLETLHIPSTVTEIADDAMDGLKKLVIFGVKGSFAENYAGKHGIPFVSLADNAQMPELVISDGITYAYLSETDSYCVVKGKNTEKVEIPREVSGKLVTEIGGNAFKDCSKLKEFSIDYGGNTLLTIGESAFENCAELRTVISGGNIDVKSNAFRNCPKLSRFYGLYQGEIPNVFAEDAFDRDTKAVFKTSAGFDSETTAYFQKMGFYWMVLEAGIDYYEEKNGFIFTREPQYDAVNDKVLYISYMTDFDDSVKSVRIDDAADEIIVGRKAFYGSKKVADVLLDKRISTIETKAFSHCENLEKIVMTEAVAYIAEDAFEECPNVVVYAPKGSYALSYAKQHGIKYKVSGQEKIPRPVLKCVRDENLTNNVTLKWNAIPYADGYQIYRLNSDTKKYERIKTIKDGNRLYYKLSLRPGKTERFKVRAYSDAVIYSEKYSPSSVRVTAKAVPDKAKIRTILTKYTNKLGVYWRQRTGADGYLLYRSEKEPYKGYKKIKYITKGSTTKYMDTGVKKGKTYYYRMRAYRMIDGKRVFGPLSDPYKVKCK